MSLAATLANVDRIALVASDKSRNIQRSYFIERSVDLFGFHLVEYRWGRVGAGGQARRAVFRDEAEAQSFVRQLLLRRDTAQRRIGVAYQAVVSEPVSSSVQDKSEAAPCLNYEALKRVLSDLRYRFMSYGLGVGSGPIGKVELRSWGGCPADVDRILAEATGGAALPVLLTLTDAMALALRLEAEATKKVYPGQGHRGRFTHRASPVSGRMLAR